MSKVLTVDQGDYIVKVENGRTIIDGDIIIKGQAFGTAPIVTNVLYVTTDGNDTNDGSAIDPTKACRTISGAVKSKLYQPGTSIKVAAGRYLENNPIVVKPYTSIIGSDLRTTEVEPINKTQDLFHVNSSSYLAQMQFINGRSGIVDPNLDRGAYAVSFPINYGFTFNGNTLLGHTTITNINDTSNITIGMEIICPFVNSTSLFTISSTVISIDSATQVTMSSIAKLTTINSSFTTGKITVYKSPYVQNCTNQSGPWLYDGTMFIPNQTVQLPISVGITSFSAGDNIISVDVSEGTIEEGMSVNTAPRNQGFFTARTIILANVQFIQEQVLEYIRQNTNITATGTTVTSISNGATISTLNTTIDVSKVVNATVTGYGIPPGGVLVSGKTSDYNLILSSNKITQVRDALFTFSFVYDKEKCSRDIMTIIEHVLYDTTFGGNSKSMQAGFSYWNGTVSYVNNEDSQTNNALDYIVSLITDLISDANYGSIPQQIPLTSPIDLFDKSSPNPLPYTSAGFFIIGKTYTIESLGITGLKLTDFTLIGARKNLVGITFIATDVGKGTGTAKFGIPFYIPTNVLTPAGSFIVGKKYIISVLGIGDWNLVADTINVTYKAGTLFTAKYKGAPIKDINDNIISYNGIVGGVAYTQQGAHADIAIIPFAKNIGIIQDIITNSPIVTAGSFITGQYYTIESIGTTIFTDVGAPSSGPGIQFIATGPGIGTGTVTRAVFESTAPEFGLDSAELLLHANRTFMQTNITNFLYYKYPTFMNDMLSQKCSRDIGYIIDAISQDILLGGNARTFEIGDTYYIDHASVLTSLETINSLDAISELSIMMQAIVHNLAYTPTVIYTITGTQVKNTKWSNGNVTINNIAKNIEILKYIISYGPTQAELVYKKSLGTTLYNSTSISADNVQQSVLVSAATARETNTTTGITPYIVTLSNKTVGVGDGVTLFFGNPTTYPLADSSIPDRWASRRCDIWGAMGGMIIDGNVVTDKSPVRSFVADAFTQVNQGGRGIRVTNRGYVQLVSVFTIFSSIAVEADNGGIASITNSNANFGTYCMIAKGYGPREFSGTLFNPAGFSYNAITNSFELNQYYPSGFFPYKQQICVFVPDNQYRPHISLMMEVIPDNITYKNSQGKPGFLTATITFSTITAGALTITGIDVSDMYIGQALYLRDQYGSEYDPVTNVYYLQPGTIITDIGPQTLYLNLPITQSGGDVNNPSYFKLFSCGNAYYTILSSQISNNPTQKSDKTLITPGGLIFPNKQITSSSNDANNPEIASMMYLGDVLRHIATRSTDWSPYNNIDIQNTDIRYNNGSAAADKIYIATGSSGLINNIIDILKGSDIISPLIVSNEDSNPATRTTYSDSYIVLQVGITLTTKGSPTTSMGDAAQLILLNLDFCVEEIYAYIQTTINRASAGSNWYQLEYTSAKCKRDVRLICINIAYDLISGGTYNSVYSGLSYYSRPGTYHIIQLEDNVTNYTLVPDGAIVNFYQRSYMSASGYLFEYVGAGTNYSALPQVGRLDPNQPNEVNMLDGGKVFFTSTDQNGDFRIGPGLVISQATGVLSGRTFQKSLFAEMTPFILAIEG